MSGPRGREADPKASKRATASGAADPPSADYRFICPRCATEVPAAIEVWHCRCGGPLLPVMPRFDPDAIDAGERGVWRYRAMLPLPLDARRVTLGEGGTPFVPAPMAGIPVWLKLDYLQPTGSYKDRGSAVLAAALAEAGAGGAVEDSSGNAGASLAAYLVGLNIPLSLFVPAGTSPIKLRQAGMHGAMIDASASSREAAGQKAQSAVSPATPYASHVYSPYFLAGTMTLAWELWEDLGRTAPDNIIVPVGHGVLLLGLFEGFRRLEAAGLISRLPRLFGVQARACAPIYEAFIRGAKRVAPVPSRETRAEGLRIEVPPRGPEVLAAVRASGGTLLNVSEDEIERGQALAANLGWYVEPSAATVVSSLIKLDKILDPGQTIVLPLTGSGLKG